TGPTTVSQGTLALSVPHAIDTTSGVVLAGGSLATGGSDQTIAGTLTVSGGSKIDLGAGAGALHFADSSGVTWGASGLGLLLRIDNWTSSSDHITFDGTGLGGSPTTGQLSQIHFTGFKGTSQLVSGELLPSTTTVLTRGDITADSP